MRPAHTLASPVLAALLVAALPARAQALPPSVTDAAAPTPRLVHRPLPASDGLETAPTDWRAAHDAVAAFPRGHADIVAWEAAQARAETPPTAPTLPGGTHHHPHPGGQPCAAH